MAFSVVQMREKSVEELKAELLTQRRAQMNLRFQSASMQLNNISEVSKTRKNIAKLKTIINEKLRAKAVVSEGS